MRKYLALKSYERLLRLVLSEVGKNHRSVKFWAVHSTQVQLWETSRGQEFLALQEAIAKRKPGSVVRLIAGPCSFSELEAKAPEYLPVMRQMVNHGVRLYYAEKSAVSAKIRDFALVQDGEILLVFKWKPHNDNHSIRDAEMTWDNRETANLKALWEVEITKSIRSGVVQRVGLESDQLHAYVEELSA